jgi:hypothetical protein
MTDKAGGQKRIVARGKTGRARLKRGPTRWQEDSAEGVTSMWSTPGRSDKLKPKDVRQQQLWAKCPTDSHADGKRVLLQGLTMGPRSIMIMWAKLIDQQRRSVSKSAVAGLVDAQPNEKRNYRHLHSSNYIKDFWQFGSCRHWWKNFFWRGRRENPAAWY